jgi:hypothetical protein
MQVIGLGHYSRTGKDTLANFMVNDGAWRGLKVVKQSFAWELKDVCHQLYGWAGLRSPEFYETDEGQKLRNVKLPAVGGGLSPVEIWCRMGTDAVRNHVDSETWVNYLLHTPRVCDILVIPDVRFPNEANAIKERGGKLVKVVRPYHGPLETVADEALLNYEGWDYVVGSSGLLSDLEKWATRLVTGAESGYWPRQPRAIRSYAESVEVLR